MSHNIRSNNIYWYYPVLKVNRTIAKQNLIFLQNDIFFVRNLGKIFCWVFYFLLVEKNPTNKISNSRTKWVWNSSKIIFYFLCGGFVYLTSYIPKLTLFTALFLSNPSNFQRTVCKSVHNPVRLINYPFHRLISLLGSILPCIGFILIIL